MIRRIHRADSTSAAIVAALRKAGVQVWLIGRPCDALTLYQGKWQPLEFKPITHKKPRKDQQEQTDFCRDNAVPVVTSPEAALSALGLLTSAPSLA